MFRRLALIVVALNLASAPPAFAQQAVDGKAVFERLRTLAGTWDATEKGNPTFAEEVVYTMTGRGTVLIEDMKVPNDPMGHMLTSYHLNGNQLVLTHFCGAGNQPRMRVTSVEAGGNHITFEMYDITNLSRPDAYHSNRMAVIFLEKDRVDLIYQGAAGPKEYTQVFQLTRRRREPPQ